MCLLEEKGEERRGVIILESGDLGDLGILEPPNAPPVPRSLVPFPTRPRPPLSLDLSSPSSRLVSSRHSSPSARLAFSPFAYLTPLCP
jgi:hypothetical protein